MSINLRHGMPSTISLSQDNSGRLNSSFTRLIQRGASSS
ncbi:Uncharacterized protein TCM_044381 isoform 2 [Theobroma cacao]|uniref:Uncharacterized protein isoform 2 n=1 Tax=Theobroma cacao TaxID=3641 RepID=A0A061FPT1_THECC|nr:Uncharacterized protein TCM_044381 isoform 2 [Theobroma cacao]